MGGGCCASATIGEHTRRSAATTGERTRSRLAAISRCNKTCGSSTSSARTSRRPPRNLHRERTRDADLCRARDTRSPSLVGSREKTFPNPTPNPDPRLTRSTIRLSASRPPRSPRAASTPRAIVPQSPSTSRASRRASPSRRRRHGGGGGGGVAHLRRHRRADDAEIGTDARGGAPTCARVSRVSHRRRGVRDARAVPLVRGRGIPRGRGRGRVHARGGGGGGRRARRHPRARGSSSALPLSRLARRFASATADFTTRTNSRDSNGASGSGTRGVSSSPSFRLVVASSSASFSSSLLRANTGKGCPSVLNTTFLFSRNESSKRRWRYLHVSARKKLGMWFSRVIVSTSRTAACPPSTRVCLSISSAIRAPARRYESSPVANHSIAVDSTSSGRSG